MADVTIMVIKSENGRDVRELTTISLPGVPRVGDTVIAAGALFEVRKVTWSAESISLHVLSESYGIAFSMPPTKD